MQCSAWCHCTLRILKHDVLCRDLKAENVLLHNQGHWVLCDFGSTTSFAGVYESTNAIMAAEEVIRKYTTPAYRAPEVHSIQLCLAEPVQRSLHSGDDNF